MNYAATAAIGAAGVGQLVQRVPKVSNIIVKPTSSNYKIEDIYKETKSIIGTDASIQMKKIIKSNGKIIVQCANNDDVKKVAGFINKNSQQKFVSDMEKMKQPKVKVVGVDIDMNMENTDQISNDIYVRNGWNDLRDKMSIKVVYTYVDKKRMTNVILEVNCLAYEMIMREKKMYVGCNKCAVFDDFNIRVCRKCGNFNHSSRKCEKMICMICSENHYAKDFTSKDKPLCIY